MSTEFMRPKRSGRNQRCIAAIADFPLISADVAEIAGVGDALNGAALCGDEIAKRVARIDGVEADVGAERLELPEKIVAVCGVVERALEIEADDAIDVRTSFVYFGDAILANRDDAVVPVV